jgi:hypothetical protein
VSTAHRPTPAEMEVLLHWILMAWSGAVLACAGWIEVEWTAIPADEWHRDWRAA